ncbi:MAG: YihY/virulence factor BrkB family protein [Spirochaetota bacterium]
MQWLHYAVAQVHRVSRRFSRDACAGRAAGLAFSTLFALVPLTAVVIALLSAFGTFQPYLQAPQLDILAQLIPAASDEIIPNLARFSDNARALGAFGLGLFAVTSVALLRAIHTTLNAIWRFRSESGVWRRISTYTTVIVIGTALLAIAVVAGPLFQSFTEGQNTTVSDWLDRLSELLLPPLLLFATLFLMIILVPSGKVAPRSAAIGALTATVGWEVGKHLFVFWTGSVMRLSVIYGSLAAVPIFLIWLYLTWIIVLVGVEVAYVAQHRHEPVDEAGTDQPPAPLVDLSEYTLRAMASVFVRFRDGMAPPTQHELDERYGAATAEAIRDGLVASGLVLDTNHGFVPSRDLAAMDVDDVVKAIWTGDGPDRLSRGLVAEWRADPGRPALDVLQSYFR